MFGRIVARPIFEYSFPIDYRQSLECLPGARKRCGRTCKESLDIVDCLGACFLHGAEACHPDMHLRGIAFDGPRCIAEERDLLRELVERSEEHTSELQSLMRISYAVCCLKKKNIITDTTSLSCHDHTRQYLGN